MSDEQPGASDDAPEEHSVSEAADAIAALLKKQPEEAEEEEEGDAPPAPDAEKPEPEKPLAPDPQLEAMKAEAQRRAQDAERTRQHLTGALNTLVPQLETAIKGEFADLRSPADLARLAQSDPARYNRFVAVQGQHAQATAARAQLARQEQEATQARHTAWQHEQSHKLGDMVPEFRDPQNGQQLAQKIGAFAGKLGYTAQQLAMASATDIALLHRAMQYEGLEAAQGIARAKAAKAPRVSEPGTRGGKPDRMQSDFDRLKKSGSTNDAAAVFENMLK